MKLKLTSILHGFFGRTVLTAAALLAGVGFASAEDCAIVFVASAPPSHRVPGKPTGFEKYNCDEATTELMAHVFKRAGFQTVVRLSGIKATKDNLRAAIGELRSHVQPTDRFAIYLLAHGGELDGEFSLYDPKSGWLCDAGNQSADVISALGDAIGGARAKISKQTGKPIKEWIKDKAAVGDYIKLLTEDPTYVKPIQAYFHEVITDEDLRTYLHSVPTEKCTLMLESCHSGAAMAGFEGTRSITDDETEPLTRAVAFEPILPHEAGTESLADLFESNERSMTGNIVVAAAVQGAESANGIAFSRASIQDLQLGTDWLPTGDKAMIGLFTFLVIHHWADSRFSGVPWGRVMNAVAGDMQSAKFTQRPQMSARHLDEQIFFIGDGSRPNPANPQPARPNPDRTRPSGRENPQVHGDNFARNFLNLHNPDESNLRLRLEPNMSQIPTGTTLSFTLDVTNPGYLFLVNYDSDGTVQLLPWSGVPVTENPQDLLEQAQCDPGQGLAVGRGRFRIFAKTVGREHVKALWFKSREMAIGFVRSWMAVKPAKEDATRSIDDRSLGVEPVSLSDFYTADLEFGVVRE